MAMDSLKAWKDVLQKPSLIDCSAAFTAYVGLNVVRDRNSLILLKGVFLGI